MKDILFLAHRIPYPPNKGDKIRSFNLLKELSKSCRVHLGAFVDDPEDWRYRSELEPYCRGDCCLVPLQPVRAKLGSLRGFVTGDPLTLPYYANRRMAAWVRAKVRQGTIDSAFVFSSAMAQYVEHYRELRRVIDFVDVDSDKWRQYAESKRWPASWVYRREAERLFRYDRRIANDFYRSIFVSAAEAAFFAELAPETSDRVLAIENGVDTDYFSDARDYINPYPRGAGVMVFTGAMDYWANVDAVTWFAAEVFPEIRRRWRSAHFFIVGARPSEAVRALGRREGVTVTGAVKDIRPYLKHASFAVAPLRIARGIQNKVLEAMAMGKPVLASPAAVEGIEMEAFLDTVIAESAADWQEAATSLLRESDPPPQSARNREFVQRRYSWNNSLRRLKALLESS